MSHTALVAAHRSGSPIAARRNRFWVRLRTLVVAGAQVWSARCAERHLVEMPDHLLKDIGIARSDIRRAVRQGRI
jgi:uncharacterized protein YjiS (DUF1127 family)